MAPKIMKSFHPYLPDIRPARSDLCFTAEHRRSRRALYYHHRNKEQLFRDVVRYQNEHAMYAGWAAAMNVLMEGGGAIGVVTTFLDTRFGETRRSASNSPHALELADSVFHLCDDIIVELQARLHGDLVRMLEILRVAGKLTILPDVNKDELAAMLAASVRGVNQTRPHLKDVEFQPRYYAIIKAILRGSAKMPARDRRRL